MPPYVLPALVAILLLLGPGLALGAAAGARGWTLLGAAPAVTLGFVGISAPVLSLLGLPWRLLPVLGALVVLSGLASAAVRPWRRGTNDPTTVAWTRGQHAAIAAAVLATTCLGITVIATASQSLDGVHQLWDAAAHANVIRFINDTGDADSVHVGVVAAPNGESAYYPATVHALASLALDLPGGAGIPRVLNAIVAPMAGIFALSLVGMVRQILPRPAVAFSVALVAGMFMAFPYIQLAGFPLLSFVPAVAAAPAVIGLVDKLLRGPSRSTVVVLGIAGAGLVTTHMSVAAAVAIAAVFQFALVLRENRFRLPRSRIVPIVVSSALIVVLSAQVLGSLLLAASSSAGVNWPAVSDPGSALGRLLAVNTDTASPQLTLAILMLVGFVVVRRYAAAIPLAMFTAVMGLLFVLSSAYDTPLTEALTAVWWNDKWRFVALFTIGAAFFAGLGLVHVRDAALRILGRVWRRSRPDHPPPGKVGRWILAPLLLALVAASVVAATDVGYRDVTSARMAAAYTGGPTISQAEESAYSELADIYDGGLVMNDPVDGSPWLYALQGIPPVFMTPPTPPYDGANFGEDRIVLLEHFDEYGDNPDVDRAVERLDVRWLIVGRGFILPQAVRAAGLEDVADNPLLDEVYANGSATIYRVQR